jgi:hypothetical protein
MSDYLWDRSGEPDEEIQKLEEILAPLSYQPRPLIIPATVIPRGRHRFMPALTIAATILLAALALGLWFAVRRNQEVQPLRAGLPPAHIPERTGPLPATSPEEPKPKLAQNDNSPEVAPRIPHRETIIRRERNRPIERQPGPETIATRRPEASAREAEGEAAKEQLMTALRLVSTKLHHAQKRTQGDHLIRNQHKVG